MKTYSTPTGRPGVICRCRRKVLLRPSDGALSMHSPIVPIDKNTMWCPLGGLTPEQAEQAEVA